MGSADMLAIPISILTTFFFAPYERQFIFSLLSHSLMFATIIMLYLQLSGTKSALKSVNLDAQDILPTNKRARWLKVRIKFSKFWIIWISPRSFWEAAGLVLKPAFGIWHMLGTFLAWFLLRRGGWLKQQSQQDNANYWSVEPSLHTLATKRSHREKVIAPPKHLLGEEVWMAGPGK